MTNTNPEEATMATVIATPSATIEWNEADHDLGCPAHWTVEPVWEGVDRPVTGGWSVGRNQALGQRLVRAIEAGAVCANPVVKVDVNGATYVHHDGHLRVSGRRMNADLKRLGF